MSEHQEQGIDVRMQQLRTCTEQVEDGAEDGTILQIIVLERKSADQDGKDLVDRDSGTVAQDETSDSTSCVVTSIELCRVCICWYIEQRSKGTEKRKILRR